MLVFYSGILFQKIYKIKFLFREKGLSEPNAIMLTLVVFANISRNWFWLSSSRASSPKLFDLSMCFLDKIKGIDRVGRELAVL